VTFDPFGDFDARGYLRNTARAKDPKIVRQMEHASFTTSLDAALAELATRRRCPTKMSSPRTKCSSTSCTHGQGKIAQPPRPTWS